MRRAGSQLAVALAAVLVAWAASPWAVTDPMVLSLVLIALAAASCTAGWVVTPTPTVDAVTPPRSRGHAPLRRGRATDPAHHPLAPRAPGPA